MNPYNPYSRTRDTFNMSRADPELSPLRKRRQTSYSPWQAAANVSAPATTKTASAPAVSRSWTTAKVEAPSTLGSTTLPGGRVITPLAPGQPVTTPGGRVLTPLTAEQKAEVAAVGYNPVTGNPNPSTVVGGHLYPGFMTTRGNIVNPNDPNSWVVQGWKAMQAGLLPFGKPYDKAVLPGLMAQNPEAFEAPLASYEDMFPLATAADFAPPRIPGQPAPYRVPGGKWIYPGMSEAESDRLVQQAQASYQPPPLE